MDALISRLRKLLETQFKGASVLLEPASPTEKVGGFLVWGGFDGMDQIDRQQMLSKVIRELPRDEQVKITAILTLTPDERSVPTEN
jgi:acid stress-induced BolA-like protein IbaG/YrbA